jgi:hypothetical protein
MVVTKITNKASRLVLSRFTACANNLIAGLYNTIAANLISYLNLQRFYYYKKKGLTYANNTNNDVLKLVQNNNLGTIYCFEKQYEKEFITIKSLEYSTRIKDSAQIVFTKLNLIWAYFDIGYDEGISLPKIYINNITKTWRRLYHCCTKHAQWNVL